MITFILCAALMIFFALTLVIAPILRTTSSTPIRSRKIFALILSTIFLLPASAIGLYRLLGEPHALDPTQLTARSESSPRLEQAIDQLVAKLKQDPNNAEGWVLLGRAYKTTQKFAEARDAFKQALGLSPDNADLIVDYAEALALSGTSHKLDGETRTLIEQALTLDSQNQHGLWLLGISDYQAENYRAAIEHWNRLLPLLPEDSNVAKSVKGQIEKAENELKSTDKYFTDRANLLSATQDPDSSSTSAKNNEIKLNVKVTLAEHLKNLIAPNDIVFVFAKAVSGPPMPLVVQRFSASKLPLAVVLDDSMSMLPNTKLSQFPQITIGARISKSGNATPQVGDLEGVSGSVQTSTIDMIEVAINQIKN